MRSAIIEKLKKLSKARNYSEQDIIYFLVECYKVLEQSNKLHEFEVIRFYRNWGCHSSLSKDAEKIFEEIYIIIKAKKYINLEERPEKEIPAFVELVDKTVTKSFNNYSFKKLKEEIEKFSKYFLDNEVPEWESFQEQLQNIIADTALIIKDGNEEIFRFNAFISTAGYPFDRLQVQISFPGGYIGGGSSGFFNF